MRSLVLFSAFAAAFIVAGCGDDDSSSPVTKNEVFTHWVTSATDLEEFPCNKMREGRDAVVSRDEEEIYTCMFDRVDSVYIWAGENDTLTAKGREFVRAQSSSSRKSSSSSKRVESSSSSSFRSSSSSSLSSSVSSSSAKSSSSISSSSSSVKSSSSYERYSKMDVVPLLKVKGEQFNPNINYGTLKDTRDGQTYRTVVVNGQTWMAENLNYARHSIGESLCFNEDSTNCDLYGRLYSREAAFSSTKCVYKGRCELGNGHIRGVCPSGWHIPSYAEAESLRDFVQKKSTALRSAKGWGERIEPGTDIYGLSFVGAGSLWPNNGTSFKYMNISEHIWVYEPSTNSSYLSIGWENDKVAVDGFTTFPIHISVRCISDKAPASSSSAKSSSSRMSSSSVSSSSAKSSSSSLSSSSQSSSSFDPAIYQLKESFFNSEKTYGELTDSRDGKKYRTITVNGLTWMAENLNFAGNDEYPLQKEGSFCYGNKGENCELYGRLYTRVSAMNNESCVFGDSCKMGNGPIQGVCPTGWHIPTFQEGKKLYEPDYGLSAVNKLMSSNGWNGTGGRNSYGLSFVGSGDWFNGDFKGLGNIASIWLYTPSDAQGYFIINEENKTVSVNLYTSFELYNSVRCVKN